VVGRILMFVLAIVLLRDQPQTEDALFALRSTAALDVRNRAREAFGKSSWREGRSWMWPSAICER
jgi:hypothetical protein